MQQFQPERARLGLLVLQTDAGFSVQQKSNGVGVLRVRRGMTHVIDGNPKE